MTILLHLNFISHFSVSLIGMFSILSHSIYTMAENVPFTENH